MFEIKSCSDQEDWDNYVLDNGGHPLQLWGWGEIKSAHGWMVERIFVYNGKDKLAGAQILIRKLPWPLNSLVYIPRGPVSEVEDRTYLTAIAQYARKYKPVAITTEPDWSGQVKWPKKWHSSKNTILIPRTIILDLEKSSEDLLADMTKKTRQYIRKSAASGIEIQQIKSREDLKVCLDIYEQTAERANFQLHNRQYYYDIFDKLGEHSPVFVAKKDDRPVAFLWLAISSLTAFELYGGMNDEGQQLRANYALKWQVITTMKQWGIKRYDFNGLLNDGVSNFKKGFASHEENLVGTYDYPLSILYPVWNSLLPLGKKVARLFKI